MPLPLVAGGILINTLIHDGNGGASNASFSVDIEQIPGLITKYEEAREKLEAIRDTATELQDIAPPGEDPVSNQMATSLGKMAGADDGQLTGTVNKSIERLTQQIEQLKAAQKDYQATDDAARPV